MLVALVDAHADVGLGPLGGAAERSRIDEVLQLIGLPDQRDRRAGLLSHGHKQWLEIGMLLVQDPKVLLLDEPIAGMSHQEATA